MHILVYVNDLRCLIGSLDVRHVAAKATVSEKRPAFDLL